MGAAAHQPTWTFLIPAMCLAGLDPQQAAAEQIAMTAIVPATSADAAKLERLTIRPFGGSAGRAFSRAFQSVLSQPDVNNAPYFVLLIDVPRQNAQADGIVDGAASASTSDQPFTQQVTTCVTYQKWRCVESHIDNVNCTMRSVSVVFDLRIAQPTSARILYSANKTMKDQVSWCEGQVASKGVDESIAELSRLVSDAIRKETSPHSVAYVVRVMETTQGLSKPAQKAFRELIKLSPKNIKDSCTGWRNMMQEEKLSGALAYDVGICAEIEGDYVTAQANYRLAQNLFKDAKKEVAASITRAGELSVARGQVDTQIASRQARLSETPRPSRSAAGQDKTPSRKRKR